MPSPPVDSGIELVLEDLVSHFPYVPRDCGRFLAQAAALALEGEKHASGVSLLVEGDYQATLRVNWSLDVTEAMRRYWNDPDETAEYGAHAIALLLMRGLAGYNVVEKSKKGTGFDWWLAPDDKLFQATARLEVSGIMSGSGRRINSRLKARIEQTRRSDASGLPAYVAVVEFRTPKAKVRRR